MCGSVNYRKILCIYTYKSNNYTKMYYSVHSNQSLSVAQACSRHTGNRLAQFNALHASPNSKAAPESTWSAVPHTSSNPLSISESAGRLNKSWLASWVRPSSCEVSQSRMWRKSTRSCRPDEELKKGKVIICRPKVFLHKSKIN